MKSLQDLAAIRDKMKQTVNTRESAHSATRIVVGMATCGIAAGARPVLAAITSEIARRNVEGIQVTQTGCIGMCEMEPIVEIYRPDGSKTTYVKMTSEKARKMVGEDIVGGKPVSEFMVGAETR